MGQSSGCCSKERDVRLVSREDSHTSYPVACRCEVACEETIDHAMMKSSMLHLELRNTEISDAGAPSCLVSAPGNLDIARLLAERHPPGVDAVYYRACTKTEADMEILLASTKDKVNRKASVRMNDVVSLIDRQNSSTRKASSRKVSLEEVKVRMPLTRKKTPWVLSDAHRQLHLAIMTWNMANERPDPEEIGACLPERGQGFELIAVGLQESSAMKKFRTRSHSHRSSLSTDSDDSGGEGELSDEVEDMDCEIQDFFDLVLDYLGSNWRVVKKLSLRYLRLAVFAHQQVVVNNVEESWSATGLGRVFGNKGALVVGMDVSGTSLCFVCCHLAAHTEYNQRRKEDIKQILQQARIRNKSLDVTMQFDHCFWFGDLNFRIDFSESAEKDKPAYFQRAKELISQNNWSELLAYDQLRRAIKSGEILTDFAEADICFPPTFKIKMGLREAEIDDSDPKKLRVPSYCDRILWKSLPPARDHLSCISFESIPSLSSSDHKPVCAYFDITPTANLEFSDTLPTESLAESMPIYITDLRTEGLNRKHAYVLFESHPTFVLGRTPATARQTSVSSNSRWADTEVPVLRPAFPKETALERLKKVKLSLDLWSRELMNDEHLGTAVISLDSFESNESRIKKKKWELSFSAKIVRGSQWCNQAMICGTLCLRTSFRSALIANTGQDLVRYRRSCSGCNVL